MQGKTEPVGLTLTHISGDITTLPVEIIVNAANPQLLPGGGVSGAIHAAAGPELAEACLQLGGCDYGEAKITRAYRLPAQYVIHTVAPVYGQHKGNEPDILYMCFYKSLVLADGLGANSIAFPALGAGTYGNPIEDVLLTANMAVHAFATNHPRTFLARIYFVHY